MHFLKVKILCAVMIPMIQIAISQQPQPYSKILSESKVRLEDVERDTYKNQEEAYAAAAHSGSAEQLQQYSALTQSSAYGAQGQAPLYTTQNAPTSPLFSPQYQYILQPYLTNQNVALSLDASALQQVQYVPNTGSGSTPLYRPVYVPQSQAQQAYIPSSNPSDYYKNSQSNIPSDYYKNSQSSIPSDYYKNSPQSSSAAAYSHKPATALKIISSPQHVVPQVAQQPQYILQPQYYQPIAYTQPQNSPYLFNTVYQTQHSTGKNIYSPGIKSTTPAAPIKERDEPFLPIGGSSRYEYSQNEVPTSFTKFRLSG